MNRSACGLIRSCLIQDIKYLVLHETSARQLWEILERKYLTKSIESRLQLKKQAVRVSDEEGMLREWTSESLHEASYRFDQCGCQVDEEDKAVILLNPLPAEEYETFTLTFINGRQSLDYHEVSSALANYETRKERQPSQASSSAEALAVRGRDSYRKGKDDRGRSKSRPGFRIWRRTSVPFVEN